MNQDKNRRRALVPRLRFSEFRELGDWDVAPLGKLAQRCTARNNYGQHTRVLTNSAEFGVIDQRDYFDKDIATQGNLESYYIVEKGSYVYNPRISITAPVGPISKNNVGVGVMSPLYTVFKFFDEQNDFFAQYFRSKHWHDYMRQVSSTGARHDRMSITSEHFMNLPLPVTIPEEQAKIADFLSSIDELIDLEVQKMKSLKALKKGLMLRLFPQEGESSPSLRFSEFANSKEWKSVSLGDLGVLVPGLTYRPEDVRDNGLLVLRSSNIKDGRIVLEDCVYVDPKIKGANLSQPNDILVCVRNGSSSLIGKNAIIPEGMPLCTHGAFMTVFRSKHSSFIYQLFQTPAYQNQVAADLGATINSINGKRFLNYIFAVPEEAEQDRIVGILSAFDERIGGQVEKITKLKEQKKGLLQLIFPAFEEEMI